MTHRAYDRHSAHGLMLSDSSAILLLRHGVRFMDHAKALEEASERLSVRLYVII